METNQKLCECGCGNPVKLSTTTHKKRGMVKGQPNRFIVGHIFNHKPVREYVNSVHSLKGDKNPRWAGDNVTPNAGRLRAQKIYTIHKHPCDRCGEKKRLLRHHIDRDTLNNATTNIEFLCYSCHGYEHSPKREKNG